MTALKSQVSEGEPGFFFSMDSTFNFLEIRD